MYFLVEICQNPGVLRVLYFVFLLIDILFIVVPISLIIMLLVDFFKATISSDDTAKKSAKMAGKRIISAVLVFCVPWIVNVIMGLLNSAGFQTGYLVCSENARSGNFAYYDQLLKAEEEKEKSEREKTLQQKRQKYEASVKNKEQQTKTLGSGENYDSMASALIGTIEPELGQTDSTKYGAPAGTPWCGYFTTWALKNTEYDGLNLYTDIIEKESNVVNPASPLCSIGTFYNNSNTSFEYSNYYANKFDKQKYTPKKGDIIYFKWGQNWDGEITACPFASDAHIGVVAENNDGNLTVYSGNSSSKVNKTTHYVDDTNIVGYGSWYSE